MPLKRSDSEINEQLSKAADAQEAGSRWPGMSYEEGVDAALSWVIGHRDEPPMED